jgi:dipeptidyl-peptidase-3
MKKTLLLSLGGIFLTFAACKNPKTTEVENSVADTAAFVYETEHFADLRILRYQVPGFEKLPLKQKELLYYLYEAGLSGRDIFWDQNYKYNLTVRKTLEAIVSKINKEDAGPDYDKFLEYAKTVWYSNGIHHHYSNAKILPSISKEYFAELVKKADQSMLPLNKDENMDAFISRIEPIIFDPKIAPKRVNLDSKGDMVVNSASNMYEGVSQKEVENFYKNLAEKNPESKVSWGLNSKLVKENGKLIEKTWKMGGMYDAAISKIVYWLEKAVEVAETPNQKDALQKLVKYYKSGDLKDFDDYCIAWVKDTSSNTDVVNGFTEVYGDPLGFRGSFESVVSFINEEGTKRIRTIGKEAQWFEDHSPIMDNHKKKNVKGISSKEITVVVESGDASPSTPIGINLPNAEWIRETYGSKSVNLGNIVDAYDNTRSAGLVKEFSYNDEIAHRAIHVEAHADRLHTDMHEVIGHASGQINKGVDQPHKTLKNYASTLEEARADLVALYYLMDQKLVDIGVMESLETGKASYDDYIINGLMLQLNRLKEGDDLEEAHMRNRQLVAKWVLEKGAPENVIEKKTRDGKTFFVVNDYDKLRKLFGDLLREIQRIKSEGDYNAGKALVENYGVKVDHQLHKEVLERYRPFKLSPFAGFINPKLVPVMENGKITDVKIEYPDDFSKQMLEYGKAYGYLPAVN